MKEQYSLTGEPFSFRLFTPHDFAVKELRLTSEELVFVFEDDVTYHDGIKELFPGKKSLILRFRLFDKNVSVYREKRKRFPWQKCVFVAYDERKLPDLCRQRLEYIGQYFSYQSVRIELDSPVGAVWIEALADCVEYEWLE